MNDYRNPLVAAAMKELHYVNMFNQGIRRVQGILRKNGSPEAEFDVSKLTVFEVRVGAHPEAVGNADGSDFGSDGFYEKIAQLTDRQAKMYTRLVATSRKPGSDDGSYFGNENVVINDVETAESIGALLHASKRTIYRESDALQKIGLLHREGGNGGKWIVLVKG